jgi:hypothetical protein
MIVAMHYVQCDGPGKEFLSAREDHVPGTELLPDVLVAAPSAERAFPWPSERAAQRGAVAAGWRPSTDFEEWVCPSCLDKLRSEENTG